MDNEFSSDLRKAFIKNNVGFELVPPNMHRRNAAERAIRSFKNHFLAGLATCDPKFPLAEWDRLLPQAELSLNLLRSARLNPKLSAHAYLFGTFNFERTPLAPPGTRVVVYDRPENRPSWGFHGTDGWYVGPALNHYRCVRCYISGSRQEHIADTVKFYPHHIPFSEVTMDALLRQAA